MIITESIFPVNNAFALNNIEILILENSSDIQDFTGKLRVNIDEPGAKTLRKIIEKYKNAYMGTYRVRYFWGKIWAWKDVIIYNYISC